MAVAFDAVGPAGGGGASGTASPLTWAHINSTASNAIVVGVNYTTGTSPQASAVTYGGVSLSRIGTVPANNAGPGGADLWGVIGGLPTGSNTVSVTFSGTNGTDHVTGGSISLSGAGSFGSPFTAFASATSVSVNVTGTAATSIVVAACAEGNGSAVFTTTGGGTLRWAVNGDSNEGADNTAGGTWAGGGTVAAGFQWSGGSADFWAIVAVEVQATSSTPAPAPANPGPAWRNRFTHRNLPLAQIPDQGSLGQPVASTAPPAPVSPGQAWRAKFQRGLRRSLPQIQQAAPPPVAVAAVNGNEPGAGAVAQRDQRLRPRAVVGAMRLCAGGNGAPFPPPTGQAPDGVIYRRRAARAVVGNRAQPASGIAGIAFPNGQKPYGFIYRRKTARASLGPDSKASDGKASPFPPPVGAAPGGVAIQRRPGQRPRVLWAKKAAPFPPPNGNQPGTGLVRRRSAARAVTGSAGLPASGAAAPFPPPSGNQPGGPVRRRTAARAFAGGFAAPPLPALPTFQQQAQPGQTWQKYYWHRQQPVPSPGLTAAPPPANGNQPGTGLVRRRSTARAVWAKNAAPFPPPAGNQPGGVVYRRKAARAVLGSRGLPAGGAAVPFPPPLGNQPGGVVYRRKAARAVWAKNAAPFPPPNGNRPGTGLVRRRASARVVAGGIAAPFPPPTGSQPGGPVRRRTAARAVAGGVAGPQPPAAPAQPAFQQQAQPGQAWQRFYWHRQQPVPSPGLFAAPPAVNGSPPGTGAVYRRKTARAVLGNASQLAGGTPGQAAPPAGIAGSLVRRRSVTRAVWAKKAAPFPPPVGSQPGGPVTQRDARKRSRAVWNGNPAPAIHVAVRAPKLVPQPPRRKAARAFIAFTPVRTTNIPFVPSPPILPALVAIAPAGANAALLSVVPTTLSTTVIVVATQVSAVVAGRVVTVTIAPAGNGAVSVQLVQLADVPESFLLSQQTVTGYSAGSPLVIAAPGRGALIARRRTARAVLPPRKG